MQDVEVKTSCNLHPHWCVVWLYAACCFHTCRHYQGSLDVIVLLQASPEQTKKQQEDADRAMENEHEKNRQGEQEPKGRDGRRPEENFLSHRNASQAAGKL
jgi:hypothetical protein